MKQTIFCLFTVVVTLLFTQSCSFNQETTLSVEAALIFKSGDVKPVARTDFYLLDKSFETILQESKFTSELPPKLQDLFGKISPLKAFVFIVDGTEKGSNDSDFTSSRRTELQIPLAKALAATKSHIISQTTTDFQGKAQFKDIKAGEYYLYGYTKAGGSVVIWNEKTVVKSGQNLITLDQKNATTSD